MNPIKFKYITSIKSYIIPIVFSFSSCVLFTYKALNNNRGLKINKIIQFSENKATIFFWCLFGFSLIFLSLFIYAFFNTIRNKKYSQGIIITDLSISVPKNGFSKKNNEIEFDKIIDVYNENYNNNPSLIIKSDSKKIVLFKKILSSKEHFETIQNLINERLTKIQEDSDN